ncbi:tetratricopeptide repeat protein [Actinocorallia longicatena]|uniref:Tetratricopeptide repeat protein n=1 Tax=Actinocorallia longicatena TaxID=111803 RepID=A0ABP6QAA5_9ACTN
MKALARRGVLLGISAAVLAVGASAVGGVISGVPGSGAERAAPTPLTAIDRYQATLRESPADSRTWTSLGFAYLERARASHEPGFYPRSEGAFGTALRLDPEAFNAMIGMGALANARHEFARAVGWARRAQRISSETPALYGVLADAHTQLGDAAAAGAAARRMAELEPGVSSFTRLSYDAERRGDRAGARELLQQALGAAYTPAERAFCRYYLGELAFHAGDLGEAGRQYDLGLDADPTAVAPLQGRAKTAALRGDLTGALRAYRTLTGRVPVPQYLLEYAELLTASGDGAGADAQLGVLAALRKVQSANGVADDLTWSELAAATGDPAGALRYARAEWDRRRGPIVADALAWALHLNGRDSEALPYARIATASGWHNALFRYHRSRVEAALGDDGAARRSLARAKADNPRFDPRLSALGRIA